MPSILAAGLILSSVPTAVAAPAATDDVRAFAHAFDQAQLRKDAAALRRMIADDLVFIGSSGKLMGKAEFIAGWTGADSRYDPITIVNPIFVQLGPDAAIVGGETVLTGVEDGKPFSQHIRFSDTFKRIGGTWKAVHIQVTPVR